MKRLIVPLLFLGLAVATYAIVQSTKSGTSREAEGNHVLVEVVAKKSGLPVTNAQVRARFGDTKWLACDSKGQYTFRDLPIRPGEEWTPKAVGEAVLARAPYLTLRQGTSPTVKRDENGQWRVRFALMRHGVLRLTIRDSHLGKMRASIHPATTPASSIEVMDGRAIARPDKAAAFRVYPDCKKLVVIFRAERGMEAVRAATEIIEFRPPGEGGMIDRLLVAKPCKPIMGRIASSGDVSLPPGAGEVVVEQFAESGARYALDAVTPIRPDGSFIAGQTGDHKYLLTVRSPYLADEHSKECQGGEDVVIEQARMLPWLEIRPSDDALGARPVRLLAQSLKDSAVWETVDGKTRTVMRIPISESGRYRIRGIVPGTNTRSPFRGQKEIDATDQSGPVKVKLDWKEAPYGQLSVKFRESDTWKSRGAKITLTPMEEDMFSTDIHPRVTRTLTLFEGPKDPQSFGRVCPGDWKLRAEFINKNTALQVKRIKVVAGEDQTIEIPRLRGCHLYLKSSREEQNAAVHPRQIAEIISRYSFEVSMSWDLQSSAPTTYSWVQLLWNADTARFESTHALQPGTYSMMYKQYVPGRGSPITGPSDEGMTLPEDQDFVEVELALRRLFPGVLDQEVEWRR